MEMVDDKTIPQSFDASSQAEADDGRFPFIIRAEALYKENKQKVDLIVYVIAALAFAAYFLASCITDFKRAKPLFFLTLVIGAYLVLYHFGGRITTPAAAFYKDNVKDKIPKLVRQYGYLATLLICMAIFVLFWTIFEIRKNKTWKNLISLAGLAAMVFLTWVTSVHPLKVNWRTVISGLALQLLFGFLVLRTHAGFSALNWMSGKVSRFLDYSAEGSSFVFGNGYGEHFFAFSVLAVIVFFSSASTVLYYLGILQAVIRTISVVLQSTMGIPASVSLSAAANIFMGQTEAPLVIKPFLPVLTNSEMFCVVVGGFATIAGGVLAAFILLGVSASHLLSASVMSAPAALAFSALSYPEVEESKATTMEQIEEVLENMEDAPQSLIEAAAVGASNGVPLALNVGAMLISFVPLISFVNNICGWIFWNVGIKDVTFIKLLSWIFFPLSWIMGVDNTQALMVSELLGIKTVINEFVAYDALSIFIKNRANNILPFLSPRSEVIATYALCGFANFSSIGIVNGALSKLSPGHTAFLYQSCIRALAIGTLACFSTACVAGFLFKEE